MSEASKAGRLLKIFSLLIYEYNHLTYDELYNNFFIHSASSEYLEQYGREIGLSRHLMTKSRGKIRVGSSKEFSSPATLPSYFTVSTKETEDRQALKYTPLRELTLSFSSSWEFINPDNEDEGKVYWSEGEIEIESVERGSIYNLDEGQITEVLTTLSPFDYVKQVGVTSSAYDREGDISFRRRILEAQRSGNELSSGYIISKTKEEFPSIDEIVINRSPGGIGKIDLIIKSLSGDESETLLLEVQEFWNNPVNKLLEFAVQVSFASPLNVDISLSLYYRDLPREEDFRLMEDGFRSVIDSYFSNLSLSAPFVREYLEKDIAELAFKQGIVYFDTAVSLDGIAVSGSIIEPGSDRYCSLGELSIVSIDYAGSVKGVPNE